MRLDIVVIQPESLEKAVEQYREDAVRRGYIVTGGVAAHWQGYLFGDTLDAVVCGQVRKSSKK
jgi:hypothetical protein